MLNSRVTDVQNEVDPSEQLPAGMRRPPKTSFCAGWLPCPSLASANEAPAAKRDETERCERQELSQAALAVG
jgi:hypothetical protein